MKCPLLCGNTHPGALTFSGSGKGVFASTS